MKKTEKNDKQISAETAQKAPRISGKGAKKPQAAKTPAKKRAAEVVGVQQADLRRMEQEMLILSTLGNFGETQEQMLNSRMTQMMHKVSHIKLPFLRMAFMARSRRILGRQQPRIEASKTQKRKPKTPRLRKKMSLNPLPF